MSEKEQKSNNKDEMYGNASASVNLRFLQDAVSEAQVAQNVNEIADKIEEKYRDASK